MNFSDVMSEITGRIKDEFKGELSPDDIRQAGIRFGDEAEALADDEEEDAAEEADEPDEA